MQRSDFDFDVISGPSSPPLIIPAPPPEAEPPAQPLDRATDRTESPQR
ncbi:hypothetical protein ACFQU2_05060 [Siccirubricoccus deserti]|uniref:Uncharacterized protein n=1 Tax=Siccirubricoccus deserti TaxID=2013562 RepID=A0A9X0QZW1_9PROT|nr:hypothetical protein [Siccirubricoccus deserti]MBC4016253.1 hypothetical protein [Siccirubricoccus deserti]